MLPRSQFRAYTKGRCHIWELFTFNPFRGEQIHARHSTRLSEEVRDAAIRAMWTELHSNSWGDFGLNWEEKCLRLTLNGLPIAEVASNPGNCIEVNQNIHEETPVWKDGDRWSLWIS